MFGWSLTEADTQRKHRRLSSILCSNLQVRILTEFTLGSLSFLLNLGQVLFHLGRFVKVRMHFCS